jgi:hypothetical protein
LFCVGYFPDGASWTICPGWLQTMILLISASQVARIAGMSHSAYCSHICSWLTPSSLCSSVPSSVKVRWFLYLIVQLCNPALFLLTCSTCSRMIHRFLIHCVIYSSVGSIVHCLILWNVSFMKTKVAALLTLNISKA